MLSAFKHAFDPFLETYINDKLTWSKAFLINTRLHDIIDHIQPIIFAGGKRTRPYCAVLGYKIYGGQDTDAIMRFALVFELLHTMALVHDDIIDEADKRHNVSTIHTYVQEITHNTASKRIAEGQALLIGDLLLAWVYEVLHQKHNFWDNLLQQAQNTVHIMIQEVVLGQMIDVDLALGEKVTEQILEAKNLYKTARYSFARPLLAWAQLAGASQEQQDLLFRVGELLGMAYQVRDDMLDVLEFEHDKTTFADVQEGQQTYLTYYVQQFGTQAQKDLLAQCMGKHLDAGQIQALKDMFHTSWAIDFTKEKIAQLIGQANAILENITFCNDTIKQEVSALLQKFTVI